MATSWIVRALLFRKISFDFADHVVTINEPFRTCSNHEVYRSKSIVVMNAVDESRFTMRRETPGVPDAPALP